MKLILTLCLLALFSLAAFAQPTIAPSPDNGPYLNVSSSGTTNFYIFATPTGWPNNNPSTFITSFYAATGLPTGCTLGDPNPFPVGAQYVFLSCTNTPAGSYSFGLVTYDNSGLRGTSRYFTIISN